ncbi:MAG: hypothetical protein AAFR60_01250 [Pseudomonadota bacterium]
MSETEHEWVTFAAGDTSSVEALDVTLSVDDIYRGILDTDASTSEES